MKPRLTLAAAASTCLILTSCSSLGQAPEDTQSALDATTSYRVLDKFPHDEKSFTQGFEVLQDTTVVESSGLYGESHLRIYNYETGDTLGQVELPDDVFGEGVTIVGDDLVQLTWKSGTAYVWDAETLNLKAEHSYDGEGWGLCSDGTVLWRSDGSSVVTAHDPETFDVVETVQVKDETGSPVMNLNELECLDSLVWANIWYSDSIIAFDPVTGEVVKRVNFTDLVNEAREDNGGEFGRDQVLNGIAHDPDSNTWLVTGKQWKWTYVVDLVE